MNMYFFLSQDDKLRVSMGLPWVWVFSKKQDVMLMHLEYKASLTDHDFPIGKSHKLIPSVYDTAIAIKTVIKLVTVDQHTFGLKVQNMKRAVLLHTRKNLSFKVLLQILSVRQFLSA